MFARARAYNSQCKIKTSEVHKNIAVTSHGCWNVWMTATTLWTCIDGNTHLNLAGTGFIFKQFASQMNTIGICNTGVCIISFLLSI